jgi:hypothetical protein
MNEQQIAATLDELVATMAAGKALEAFDTFYHDDLEKTDLDGVTHRGKAENRRIDEALLAKVVTVRDFTAVGKVVTGNRSFLVWFLDYDHADDGPVKLTEVAIQNWHDGKIIREQYVA